MFYRETGQFKSSYAADQAILPIRQDRIGLAIILLIAFLVIPVVSSEYWLSTIMLPFLIFSLAALGLNILTGYAGQLSLGTGGFMACGAFAAYKLATGFPDLNIVLVFGLAAIPLFLGAGMAIDIARHGFHQQQLNTAVDGAALVGLPERTAHLAEQIDHALGG